ncbi:MAG: M24 family metallopeptidase [Chloroflexota bacterium]
MSTGGREARRGFITELMDLRGVTAIALRRPPNFAWYTGGVDNRVDHSSEFGVADVVVTRDADFLVANDIEAARMTNEGPLDLDAVQYPWYDLGSYPLREITGGRAVGTDFPYDGAVDVSSDIQKLRCTLDSHAIDQYLSVGADTMEAVVEVENQLRPGITEWEAAAELELQCRRRRLYTPVIMAAGDGRIERYRHPVLYDNRCQRRIMIVVCAERYGLYANLTRIVNFEEPSPAVVERSEACETILRLMREVATIPGRTLADALEQCKEFYAQAGYPDEWKLHHQGGLTGYATREIVATPTTDWTIAPDQAFSWNPSITGAKAEETFVLRENGPVIVASFSGA